MEEHGENAFTKQVYEEIKCACGEQTIGDAVPGCPDCGGTGEMDGATVKCPKCSKHVIIPPRSAPSATAPEVLEPRWSCSKCGWRDNATSEQLADAFNALPDGKPTKQAALKRFFVERHDNDIRTGAYICPACQGEGTRHTKRVCKCSKRVTYSPNCPTCHGKGSVKTHVDRYCVRQPFNANSNEQIKRYVQAINHPFPKIGLGRDGIGQLARSTGDSLYSVIHGIKTIEAIGATMAPITAAAAILTDASDIDRVHTKFMFIDAAGAVTSREPDIISAPPAHKYPGLAELWAKCLVTRPSDDTRLIRLDYGPLELQMFALEAHDEGLLEIAPQAETWLLNAANFKRTVQGTGAVAQVFKAFMRGTTAQTVYQQNRHLFSAVDTVSYLLSKLEYHFPRALEYRRMVTNQAHRQGYLRSKFGFERQFYAVLRRNRETGAPEPGPDFANAASFAARNHAASILAIAAMRPVGPDRHLITPTLDQGNQGLLLEVPATDPVTDLPPIIPGVLTLPDGSPWKPIETVVELGASPLKGPELP
jgi:hypothetical protein